MKSKTLSSLIVVMALCFSIKAQNLVPNYSFEQIVKCTNGWGEFNGYVMDWTGQNGASSGLSYYTHQCSNDSLNGGSVPYNYDYGFQYAHSGVSYAEIITFVTSSSNDSTHPYGNTSFANQRNYLQALLTDSLKAHTEYFVTFFVSLQNASNYACSDIGAYFSDSAILFNGTGGVLQYVPQIANNPKQQELSDTLNWMKITGSFIAKGGEKYITIGNFKNDSLSSVRYLGQIQLGATEAWYYIDDVIVSTDSAYVDSLATVSVQSVSNPKEVVSVFPNPSKGIFTIEQQGVRDKEQVEIYNMMGQKVASSNSSKGGASVVTTILPSGGQRWAIDLSDQPAGIYLYRIVSEKGEAVGTGKLIIQ